jgi:hypothetical protein
MIKSVCTALLLIAGSSGAFAELVGPAGGCGIPSPSTIVVPQPAISGQSFPIWVCADARAYPDGYITPSLPVIDNVTVEGNTIRVEVSVSQINLFSGPPPKWWQVLALVNEPGEYTIEYYTILRPNSFVPSPGEPRRLRATSSVVVGFGAPTQIDTLSTASKAIALSAMIILGGFFMRRKI